MSGNTPDSPSPSRSTTPARPTMPTAQTGGPAAEQDSESPARTRGIVWTLEAFLAVLLLLGALTAAAYSIPPSSSESGASDVRRTQLQHTAQDQLLGAAERGEVTDALVQWDAESGEWLGAGASGAYVGLADHPDHPLYPAFESVPDGNNTQYNIVLAYDTPSGTETKQLVYQGAPGSDSVSASYTTVLTDQTTIHIPDGEQVPLSCDENGDFRLTVAEAANDSNSCSYFAPDMYTSGATEDRFNVIEVTVTMWQR